MDRSLSPWNTNLQVPSSSFSQSLLADTSATAPTNLTFSRLALNGIQQLATTEGQVQTVTSDSSNILQAGIPIYVNSIHIATANAFMTTFLISLVVAAIALALAGFAYGALYAADRFAWGTEETRERLKSSYPAYMRAWALRLVCSTLPPVSVP